MNCGYVFESSLVRTVSSEKRLSLPIDEIEELGSPRLLRGGENGEGSSLI